MLCKEYGVTIGELSPIQARLLLLQWENNNMQAGYHFREFNGLMAGEQRGNGTREPVETIDVNQKIDIFLRENGIQRATNHTSDSKEERHLLLDPQQKERQREKIISLLAEKGIVCEKDNPHKLFKEVMHWLLHQNENPKLEPVDDGIHEETRPETMYVTKIKQFANVLLNEKEDVLSEETASEIVKNWVDETLEDLSLLEEKSKEKGETKLRHAKKSHSPWKSPKLMTQMNQFLQKKELVPNKNKSRETTMVALGKWLIPDMDEVTLRPDRFQPLAKMILKQLKLYGGKNKEKILDKDAEATVMKWVFENVLGTSIERHIAQRIAFIPDPGPATLSISSLRTHLERSPYDQHYGRLSVEKMSAEGQLPFKRLWEIGLERILPDYLFAFDEPSESNRDISDYDALTQLIGAKLVEHAAYQPNFNKSEMRLLVDDFLETTVEEIEKKKVSLEALQIISLPALLTTAQVEPDLLRTALIKGDYMKVSLSVFVSYYKKGYFKLIERQAEIDHLFKDYQNAVLHWRGKSVLANEIVQECYKSGVQVEGNPVPLLSEHGSKVTTQQAIDRYLGGTHPCPTAHWKAPDLDEWFNSLTKNVTEASFNLDKKIIPLAFESMEPEESQFLFSSKTQIYKATSEALRFSTVDELIRSISLFAPLDKIVEMMGIPGFKKKPPYENFKLKNTDLFVAKQGEEERVYALKRLENEGGYAVYRVDRNAALYAKYELFGKEFQLTPMDRLTFKVDQTNERFTDVSAQDKDVLSTFTSKIAETHRDDLNERLSQSGEAKQMKEMSLEMLLSLVPFYDCITEINKGETEKAAIACTIDILLLIPLVGEAVALSTKFGLGVARAFLRGSLKNVLRSTGYFIPKATDFTRLGISTLRYLDPGVETAVDGSRLLIKSLTKIRTIGKRTPLLKKLERLESKSATFSASFVKVKLPKNGPEVFVKQVKDKNLYVRVTNPKTGDAFGEYFLLKNNQLEVFKGPVRFSEEQKQMIHAVAVKIEGNQQFIDEKNANPMAYGEAPVRTVIEKNKPNQWLIKMNDQWVPVRETAIKGHGVRYDAVISEQLIPVNYNGMEWYFEAATSPFIAKKIEKKIGRKLGKFETLSDSSVLSAPDERGLMRDISGRSYIKIKNYYVPLILLDERAGRYHLVKKNANSPMMILKFHPEFNQFGVETVLERKIWEAELKLEYDKFEANYHRTGGSQPGGSQQVALPKLDLGTRFSFMQEIDKLPIGPDISDMWNTVRQASVRPPSNQMPLSQIMIQRLLVPRDLTVQPQRLTNFIPNRPNVVLTSSLANEIELKKDMIWNKLNPQFAPLPNQPKLDFRVIKGVDTSNSPDFLRPFQKDLKKGVEKGIRAFLYLKDRCQQLATIPDISVTREGKYLEQMFVIEHAIDKNQILKEINQRLLSIAERGEQILQATIDTGFENIWIASTDLVLNQNTGKYETRLVKDGGIYAFVFTADPQARMVFIADSFHLPPHSNIERKQDLFKVVLHETTHLGSHTADVAISSSPLKGFEISGRELLDSYHINFPQIIESPAFYNFVDRLAEQQNLPNLSPQAVARTLFSDDMLRVNLQMEDAEMIAVITRDLAEGRSFDFKKRIERNLDEQPLEDQLATIFQNYALASLFNLDQYHLSPHLNKTQDQENIKNSADHHKKMEVEKEKDKSTANVNRGVEKRGILNVIATGIEKSNDRRSMNRKSSKFGELAIN